MLRASSHHLQPILFTAPAPLFALLPTLTNRTNVSFALLQKSSNFHPKFVLTQPIYNHSYCNQGSKFKRVPHMVGKPCTPQATGLFLPRYLKLFRNCSRFDFYFLRVVFC